MARGITGAGVLNWVHAALIGLLMFAASAPAEARMCRYFGTAPFCDGSCPGGWVATGRARSCFSGRKVECCERMGSTTSDGPGSPYTAKRPGSGTTTSQRPPDSRDRAICDGNCPWPSGSAGQEACINKCLAHLHRRR